MAYKPEVINHSHHVTRQAFARARRSAKKASSRVMRRAARRDPENAPTRRIISGWID